MKNIGSHYTLEKFMGNTYFAMTNEMKNAADTRKIGFKNITLLDYIMQYDGALEKAACSFEVPNIMGPVKNNVSHFLDNHKKDDGAACLSNIVKLIEAAAQDRESELRREEVYIVYFVKTKFPAGRIHYKGFLYATDRKYNSKPKRVSEFGVFDDKNEVERYLKDKNGICSMRVLHQQPLVLYRDYYDTTNPDRDIEQAANDFKAMAAI